MFFEQKFLALDDEIPPAAHAPSTVRYRYWRRAGHLLFLSGHGPRWGDDFRYKGKVGRDLSVEEGYAAARLTALNLLQTVRQALGSLDRVCQFVDVFGAVNSAPGLTEQGRVMNGFSECIYEIFGEAGYHTRMAIGVPELPYGIAVEIKLVLEVSDL
jgi:enamine deaminase RidA (YjgF/YER057c/UK114 family)